MNLLPLIPILFLLYKNGFKIPTDLIKSIDINSLLPLLKLSGRGNFITDFLSENTEMISDALNGNFSVEKAIPAVLNAMNASSSRKENAAEQSPTAEYNYLNPISDISYGEINYELSHYFSNT